MGFNVSKISIWYNMSEINMLDIRTETYDKLKKRIYILNSFWEGRAHWDTVTTWLANFTGKVAPVEEEHLHALYILSQFMYFGSREIRVLLRSLYRDIYLLPLIQEVRSELGGDRDINNIKALLQVKLDETRFMGIGNPAESGVHLLYYFRQENSLKIGNFADVGQIFKRNSKERILRYDNITRYVFIDDFCGSGQTAIDYSADFLDELLSLGKGLVKIYYFCLFATKDGLDRVRTQSLFGDNCAAVFELDSSYKFLGTESRYKPNETCLSYELLDRMVREYGNLVYPYFPCGFSDSQCLIGFHHNTPDNTLPIIWQHKVHDCPVAWSPIFKRYPKL